MHLRAIKTKLTGDSSVAFRVGVITSDKGHGSGKFAEVNRLVLKNRGIFSVDRVRSCFSAEVTQLGIR